MRFSAVLTLAGVIALAGSGTAFAGDPESCKTVKFSDVGWTDITATTAIANEILKGPAPICRSVRNIRLPFRNTPMTKASRILATSRSSRIRSKAKSSASSPATTATA
jgi:hypothetical protein